MLNILQLFLLNKKTLHSQRNENVTLECIVISRPFARLFWEKNGQLIEENRMSHTRVNQTMSSSRLTIQMNTNDDFGQYTCIAENIHGRMEENVIVYHQPSSTNRHSKYHSSRTNGHRITNGRPRSTITTPMITMMISSGTAPSYIEREIIISSSSHRQSTFNRLGFVFLVFAVIQR